MRWLLLCGLLLCGSANAQMMQSIVNAKQVSSGLIAPNAVTSSTLKVWLQADAGCLTSAPAACTNGDTVATWQDQSGNSNNATKCSAGPLFNTNSFANGKPAIQFAAGGSFCMTTSYAGTAGTVIVVNYNVLSGFYGALISGKPQAGVAITAYDIYSSLAVPANQRLFTYGTTSDPSNYSYSVSPEQYQNVWSIAGMTNDGTTLNAYEQNSILMSATIPGGATVYTATGQVIGAGDYNNSVGSYYTGMIAEIVVYQGKISPSDYAGVVAWLQNKYGITPSGNYLMMANNRANGSYGDLSMYLLQSVDGANWNTILPTNYVPTLLSGQSVTGALAPILLHDDQGYLAKYNGLYWAESSRCAYPGTTYPCHFVDILYSADKVNWTLSGTIDCDGVGITGSSRGCYNDGWFVDRGNSNAVYAFFNATSNMAQLAGTQAYAAAVTLNSNGSFTLGAITALAGSSFPFGSTGTPNSGFFVEQIVDLSGTYYAFFSDLTNINAGIHWATSSAPFTGYNGSSGILSATAGTGIEWPTWLQSGGNGTLYWDEVGSTPNRAGTATDSALGTVSGLAAYVPQTWPVGNPLTGFIPQAPSPVRLPEVALP